MRQRDFAGHMNISNNSPPIKLFPWNMNTNFSKVARVCILQILQILQNMHKKSAPKNLHTELKLNFEQRFHLASDQTSSGWKFKCEHILPPHHYKSTSDWKNTKKVILSQFQHPHKRTRRGKEYIFLNILRNVAPLIIIWEPG